MMTELVEELATWIPKLWAVGVEQGVELQLVHRSLKFCKASSMTRWAAQIAGK